MQQKTILVADDETPLRDFVARNLRARGFAVTEATNGLEALALWGAESCHLLILDVMMPRMDGLEVTRRVRERSTVPIVVLTALDEEADKVAAFDLGADDYLTKPFGVGELMARVQAVLRRSQWAEPAAPPSRMRRFGEIEVDLEEHVVRVRGREVKLTPTEFALLAQMVSHPNKVLTHRMLLQRVWGDQYGDEPEYLRVYVGRLRRKLEPEPGTPRYLVTEPGTGYRFVP
ncbi:MAG: response regulator transcription factor [Chloroflexales bacterium]|nr:response regulator transcription factor [Chloroflexales bacterium]